MKQLTCTLFFLTLSIFCFSNDTLSIFDHLSQDAVLKMTLETDLKDLIKKKFKENYQEVLLTHHQEDGSAMQHVLKVRTRGNARKTICYFPPLKLKFPKKNLEAAGMYRDMNKLKLVCQCKQGGTYKQYVLKEYLVYRLLNVMTDMSFKVQLTEIVFKDSKSKRKSFSSFGFLIESVDQLNHRFEGLPYNASTVNPKYTVPEQTDMLHLFQYMIGNTDWSIRKSHNVYSFRTPRYQLPVCIPYDFDYAGMVNTHYAVPAASLSISEVKQRLFRGICRPPGSYELAAQQFIEKKEALYDVIKSFEYLNERERNYMVQYLDSFFKIIEHPKSFQLNVIDHCR